VYRKDGQQTQEELQKRNLREELEERERKHYSSKDKSYAGMATFSVSFFCSPLQDKFLAGMYNYYQYVSSFLQKKETGGKAQASYS
jgi:predicted aminopeptidase